MNTTHHSSPFGLPDAAPELARRFAMIMAGLGALVARRLVRMPHLAGLTALLWGRLNRAVRRLHRALTLRPSPPAARASTRRADRPRAALRLPSGRGWLVRELGWEAAAYMSQLEALLGEAAALRAVAASPEAGRILRPICRMLGVSAAVTPKILPAATPVDSPAIAVWPPASAARTGTELVAISPGSIFSGG